METPAKSTPSKKKKSNKIELNANKECPISSVTVFNDRAEVTRVVTTDLEKGDTEITISGVSHGIDSNSIRLAGTKGAASILEVSTNTSYTKEPVDVNSRDNLLKEKKEELKREISKCDQEDIRINKEHDWFIVWSNSLKNPTKKQPGLFSSDNVLKFLEYYRKRLEDTDLQREKNQERRKKLQEELEKCEKEMGAPKTESIQEILIVVHAKGPTQLQLRLAYITTGASWQASYDARVTYNQATLELTYYGNIVNDTGEDWIEAQLALSTAQPSVAGQPPELYTKFVDFKIESYGYHGGYGYGHDELDQLFDMNQVESLSMKKSFSKAPASYRTSKVSRIEVPSAKVLTTTATQSTTCTTFTIPRQATIVSDNKPHKVTIKILCLSAEYTYSIIPKLSPHAYLKATIKNTETDTPFLPGHMNVFMDNNFVSKSVVPLVSPNESLGVYLGIDQGIKFEHLPIKQLVSTQGMILKSKTLDVKYKTIITNNKANEIKVVLLENLPNSSDGQIKIKLIEPVIVPNDKATKIGNTNNIRWKRMIPPGKKLEIGFHYAIEYPVGKQLKNAW